MKRTHLIRQRQWLLTSEAVAPGHPDKACDQLSDLIVDFVLERDPDARVSAETLMSNKFLAICGEFRTEAVVMEEARLVLPYRIRDHLALLYPEAQSGFDWASAKKTFEIKAQTPETSSEEWSAVANQGIAFGFACDETENLMPLSIDLGQKMMERHFHLFKKKAFDIGSDARCQITVSYEGSVPKSVEKVVLISQHGPHVQPAELKEFVIEEIIKQVIPGHLRSEKLECLVNPAGNFIIGGPQYESGMTGRKLMVDSYGSSAPTGGSALSGKDPSQIHRTANYMARALAKSVILAGLSTRCLIQLAYTAGKKDPLSILVDFQGCGLTSFTESAVERIFSSRLDLSIAGMIKSLNLRRPIYLKTATFGHYGRELPEFTWEKETAENIAKVIEKTLSEVRSSDS